ncbi:hypothetical protein GGI42DRAFT_180173 [Trichoderma sp. SZMC 28013]
MNSHRGFSCHCLSILLSVLYSLRLNLSFTSCPSPRRREPRPTHITDFGGPTRAIFPTPRETTLMEWNAGQVYKIKHGFVYANTNPPLDLAPSDCYNALSHHVSTTMTTSATNPATNADEHIHDKMTVTLLTLGRLEYQHRHLTEALGSATRREVCAV